MKRILLIGTTNTFKREQIRHALIDCPFELISLEDITQILEDPEESADTLEGNALIKAKYYAEKTGFLTLADDTGLFIPALNHWPGVHTFRGVEGETIQQKRHTLLKKMQGIPMQNRDAYFEQALVLYDPETQEAHISYGRTHGKILEQEVSQEKVLVDFGYNTLFFLEEIKKTYSECTPEEIQKFSQRGKALQKMDYYFTNSYGERSMMVAIGIVVQKNKILMNLRNDPHNPNYHNKWEFPGGKVDVGETISDAVLREVREESGFSVHIVEMIPHLYETIRTGSFGTIKLYLTMFVCTPVEPQPDTLKNKNNKEVLDSKWFELESIYKQDLIADNKKMIQEIEPFLKKFIA